LRELLNRLNYCHIYELLLLERATHKLKVIEFIIIRKSYTQIKSYRIYIMVGGKSNNNLFIIKFVLTSSF